MARVGPESHGLHSRDLLALLQRLESSGLDPHALVIARRGQVLFEGAWAPHTIETPAQVYSVSKTFTALAIGYLEAEGRIDLAAGVDRYLELPNPYGMTVRHLLTMNTGHTLEQALALPFSTAELLTIAPEHTPGTHFAYNSAASFALGSIITAITGEQLTTYLRPRLLDPLGIGPRWWRELPTDPSKPDDGGPEQAFSGFHLRVTDVARVAIALAAGGRWNGAQVIPASFIQEMATPWSDTSDPLAPSVDTGNPGDWSLGYGYQVWLSAHGFRLDGAHGQFGLVIPDRGIVIAYQGATNDTQSTLSAFWQLVESFSDDKLCADAEASVELTQAITTLDSWPTRPALAEAPGDAVDVTGWEVEEVEGGWTLTLPAGTDQPSGTISVSEGVWRATTLRAGSRVLNVTAQGERLPDGTATFLLVDLTSPHRIMLRRESDGSLRAAWSTTPILQTDLGALTVPTWITAPDPAFE